jgi:hypothetical protein
MENSIAQKRIEEHGQLNENFFKNKQTNKNVINSMPHNTKYDR